MIIKNTDPYKLKRCNICKKDIKLKEKYFGYPLSLQQICIECSKSEIPKIIENLKKDLDKINHE
ncbi:MAG: hypothetical protein DA328_08135 [Nitrososphaeraceae archaeon]|nr:hypothetical protein [Nitrososphaeraceae archaeon]